MQHPVRLKRFLMRYIAVCCQKEEKRCGFTAICLIGHGKENLKMSWQNYPESSKGRYQLSFMLRLDFGDVSNIVYS